MNIVARTLGKVVKRFANIGLGQIPGVLPVYRFVWKNFGPKGVMQTEVDGLKLLVACRDWAVAPTMIFAHSWEPAETDVFKTYIKEGMTVIDAGAYIGYYSVLASKLVGDKGKVYSFEPSPETLDLLRKNIVLNGCTNVEVVAKAISDKQGSVTFYPNPRNLSGSTMFNNYSTIRSGKDPQIEVPTTTLDDVVGDRRVDFIKMDIEGAETSALLGMRRILKNSPDLKMIVEVFPIGLSRLGSSLESFIALLQENFNLHIMTDNGITGIVGLLEIQEAIKKTAVINLFCDKRK